MAMRREVPRQGQCLQLEVDPLEPVISHHRNQYLHTKALLSVMLEHQGPVSRYQKAKGMFYLPGCL